MNSDISLLSHLNNKYKYDYLTAKIINLNNNQVINFTEDNNYQTFIGIGSKRLSCLVLAFILHYQTIPSEDCVVLSRNLLPDDCSVRNLKLISRRDYKKIQRLLRNARKYLKLNPHPTDYYKIVVEWLDFNSPSLLHRKVFEDSSVAKKFLKKKLIQLLKELERLGVDVEQADVFVNKPRL